MPILLVVDMQPRFSSSRPSWLIRNVSREIHSAMKKSWGIVFLEYTRRCGRGGVFLTERTHGKLLLLVEGYEHAMTVHKESDDGSREVLHAIDGWYGDDGREHSGGGIRVVGVNTGCCVADTVNGLTKIMPYTEIVVVGNACNHVYENEQPSTCGQDMINENVAIVEVS